MSVTIKDYTPFHDDERDTQIPLLSVQDIIKMADEYGESISTALDVKAFYEAKIASGELRVNVKAKLLDGNPEEPEDSSWSNVHCSNCLRYFMHGHDPMPGEFCRCGAMIVE